jgi:ribonuclease HI
VTEILLYTDGGSQHNGGLAAIAWLVEAPTGQILTDGVEVIGNATNNEAEYRALLRGLEVAQSFRPTRVRCYSDSEFMVNQLRCINRLRAANLRPLYAAVRQLEQGLEISYHYVSREHPRIRQADRALRAAREASLNEVVGAKPLGRRED